MIIVADTGPLIGLAKIQRIMLLEGLADTIIIPPMVRREMLGKVGEEMPVIDEALTHLLQVQSPEAPPSRTEDTVAGLGAGERQVIELAATMEDEVVILMDDQAGRRVARRLDLPVTGLIGVLIRLKEIGEIAAVVPLVETVRERGYWLSDEIVAVARRMAGED